MDTEILYALRSPSGVPTHPAVFWVLLVVTWAAHYLAVCVMLGTTSLSLYASLVDGVNWRRLSEAMLDTAKVAVSIAIVLGVAPLLFVQVIYDPFWYVSNVLSARWVLVFILVLLAAYYALYHRYFASSEAQPRAGLNSLAVALVLLLFSGFIMHVLTSQMLRPELWLRWYAPQGHIDPTGAGLHEFNIFRYGYFIALAIPVTGAWLQAYARYLSGTKDSANSLGYRVWLARLGCRCLSVGGTLALLLMVFWMSTLPDLARGFSASIWSALGAFATLGLALIPLWLKSDDGASYWPAAYAAGAMLAVSVVREALRLSVLRGVHGYDPFDYPVHFDTYGTVLFFLSFVFLGAPAVAYSIALTWGVGHSSGKYTATPRVARLGLFSLVALAVWITQYFIFGFITLVAG